MLPWSLCGQALQLAAMTDKPQHLTMVKIQVRSMLCKAALH
jgi:hypothetical protein